MKKKIFLIEVQRKIKINEISFLNIMRDGPFTLKVFVDSDVDVVCHANHQIKSLLCVGFGFDFHSPSTKLSANKITNSN